VHVFEAGLSQEMQLQIMVSADAFVAPLDEPGKWELGLAAASMRVPVVMPPWQHNNVSIHVKDFGAAFAAEGAGGGDASAAAGAGAGMAGVGALAGGQQAVQPKIKSAFKTLGRALQQEQGQQQQGQQGQQGQQQQRRRLQRFSKLKRKQGLQELPQGDTALQEAVEMRALAAGARWRRRRRPAPAAPRSCP
jgi:hypothetical protein